MLVKLRIQNPNDLPVEFNGVFVQLDMQGKPFATGVSDARGIVPRYRESIVKVPVSIPVFRIVRQVIGIMTNEYHGKPASKLTGKLAGTVINSVRFNSKGDFTFLKKFLRAPAVS